MCLSAKSITDLHTNSVSVNARFVFVAISHSINDCVTCLRLHHGIDTVERCDFGVAQIGIDVRNLYRCGQTILDVLDIHRISAGWRAVYCAVL